MLHFDSDYMEGAHPDVLRRLVETNMEQTTGYGDDVHSREARRKIAEACGLDDAEVHLLVGGTQTNAVVLGALLRPWEGVVAAETGHIAVHEAGAIEATGHKVLTVPSHAGKVAAGDVEALFDDWAGDANREHEVRPAVVYVSQPTEWGTLYTLDELRGLSEVCRRKGLLLYVDGARLGYGLAADTTGVTLPVLAGLCDAFYVGGTKVGALCGEAVVAHRGVLPDGFFSYVKRQGALLAKGRLLGVQFDSLFTDDLYLRISRHAIDMARRLARGLTAAGYEFHIPAETNQLFLAVDEATLERLSRIATFGFWQRLPGGRTVIRFATSWATRREDVDELIACLGR